MNRLYGRESRSHVRERAWYSNVVQSSMQECRSHVSKLQTMHRFFHPCSAGIPYFPIGDVTPPFFYSFFFLRRSLEMRASVKYAISPLFCLFISRRTVISCGRKEVNY